MQDRCLAASIPLLPLPRSESSHISLIRPATTLRTPSRCIQPREARESRPSIGLEMNIFPRMAQPAHVCICRRRFDSARGRSPTGEDGRSRSAVATPGSRVLSRILELGSASRCGIMSLSCVRLGIGVKMPWLEYGKTGWKSVAVMVAEDGHLVLLSDGRSWQRFKRPHDT